MKFVQKIQASEFMSFFLLVDVLEFNIIRDVNKKVEAIDNSIKEVLKLSLEEFVLSDNLPTMETVSRRSTSLLGNEKNENASQLPSRTQEVVYVFIKK